MHFYPTYPDQNLNIHRQNNDSLTRTMSGRTIDATLPNTKNIKIVDSQRLSSSRKRHHIKTSSKYSNDTSKKYVMYDMPATALTLKKQYKYSAKIGSTNDKSDC